MQVAKVGEREQGTEVSHECQAAHDQVTEDLHHERQFRHGGRRRRLVRARQRTRRAWYAIDHQRPLRFANAHSESLCDAQNGRGSWFDTPVSGGLINEISSTAQGHFAPSGRLLALWNAMRGRKTPSRSPAFRLRRRYNPNAEVGCRDWAATGPPSEELPGPDARQDAYQRHRRLSQPRVRKAQPAGDCQRIADDEDRQREVPIPARRQVSHQTESGSGHVGDSQPDRQ